MGNVFGTQYREEMKLIVKEALKELVLEGVFKPNVVVEDRATIEEVRSSTKPKVVSETATKVEKAEKPVDTKEVDIEAIKLELDGLNYNSLKAKAKELGLDATGKKVDIYERIVEFYSGNAQVAPKEVTEEKASTASATTKATETPRGEEDGDSEEVTEMKSFLLQLPREELLAILDEMGLERPIEGAKNEAIVNFICLDNYKKELEEALEALGYYEDDEEEVVEDEEENPEYSPEDEEIIKLRDDLRELTLEVLADLNVSYDLSSKGKKEALVDRLIAVVKAEALTVKEVREQLESISKVEVVQDDLTPEQEGEGWYSEDELNEFKDMELINLAKEYELEIPYKGKGALRKLNRKAVIELLLDLPNQVENEDEEVEEVEENITEARKAKEDSLEAELKAQYPKKLKDTTIAKFLKDYYDGDPAKSKLTKEEALKEYIRIQKLLVDDEGDLSNLSEGYVRGENYYCCGKELKNIDGVYTCEVCGEEYEA